MSALNNSEAWTQICAFFGLLVVAWWIGPFPHCEPVESPGLFDPASKSWNEHRRHMYAYDPGLRAPEIIARRAALARIAEGLDIPPELLESADASSRLGPVVDDIVTLTTTIDAIAKSRVPANLLFIPED